MLDAAACIRRLDRSVLSASQGKRAALEKEDGVDFELVTRWRIAAPLNVVWDALTDVEDWPSWWPYVRAVRTVRQGDEDGVGRVRRIEWRTRLPYEIVIEVETIEVVRHARLRGRSRGQLVGEGTWLLRPHDGGTEVTYVWQVRLAKRWMRRLAPLLAPVFRWNHDQVRRSGEAGLKRRLLAPTRAGA